MWNQPIFEHFPTFNFRFSWKNFHLFVNHFQAQIQNFIKIFKNLTEIYHLKVRWGRRKFVSYFAKRSLRPSSTRNNSRSIADRGMRFSLLCLESWWWPNEPIIMTVSWVEALQDSCQYAISELANCIFLNLCDRFEEKQLQFFLNLLIFWFRPKKNNGVFPVTELKKTG